MPYLPVCHRQVEARAQIQRCIDRLRDRTVKSDRSAVVLRHFGLGHTIGFQAVCLRHFWWKASRVLTSADSNVQVSATYINQTKQVSDIYGAWCRMSGACHSKSVLETSWLHRWGRYGVFGLDDTDHPMIVNCQGKQGWFDSITIHWNIWWFEKLEFLTVGPL